MSGSQGTSKSREVLTGRLAQSNNLQTEYKLSTVEAKEDRLCGLVVRVSGYRYRGPGFDPRRYQIF